MKNEKVFLVSLHKTGTTSLSNFLEKLGYLVTGPDLHAFYAYQKGDYSVVDQLLETYDAFQDDPWYLLYEYVEEKYPNSKFIFLERNVDSWLDSVQRFYKSNRYNNKVRKHVYGAADTIENSDLYRTAYEKHNSSVITYFENNPNFLAIRIDKPNDAIRLQQFLGKPIKFQNFEHYNKTPTNIKEENERAHKLKKKSGYGLLVIFKKIAKKLLSYQNYLKLRDQVRYYRSYWRVKIKKRNKN